MRNYAVGLALDFREVAQACTHHLDCSGPGCTCLFEDVDGSDPGTHRIRVQVLPTWTDHRGHGSALNNSMTTKNQGVHYS